MGLIIDVLLCGLYVAVPQAIFACVGKRPYLWKWSIGGCIATGLSWLAVYAYCVSKGLFEASDGGSLFVSAMSFPFFAITLWIPSILLFFCVLGIMRLLKKQKYYSIVILQMSGFYFVVAYVWVLLMSYELLFMMNERVSVA